MSKALLDSELYGDIYGDEEGSFDGAASVSPISTQTMTSAESNSLPAKPMPIQTYTSSSSLKPASAAGLPAKPSPETASTPPSSTLSYSAQIAQQFSSYSQTPSQERQQSRMSSAPAPIPTSIGGTTSVTPGGNGQDSIFGKKPSEMHDAGYYMSQFGKVDALTVMRDPSGTSRGFAFMTFEDPSVLDIVLSKTHHLDGKLIDPKRAIPREEHLRNTRYFVGGLASATTPETMKSFFAAFGKVVDATVMMDRESNRSKGFGFVTFEDATQATTDQICGKIGLILDEKEIEVKTAEKRTNRDSSRPMSTPSPISVVQTSTPPPNNVMGTTLMNQQQQQQPLMNPMALMSGPGQFMNMNPMNGVNPQMMRNGVNPMMNMGMGGMNPMMMAAMGMNPMMNMNAMNGMGGMGMGAAAMGMNPMMNGMAGMMQGMPNMGMMGAAAAGGGAAAGGQVGMTGIAGAGAGIGRGAGVVGAGAMGTIPGMQRQGVAAAGVAGNGGVQRMASGGVGPARTTQRGQHNFHPYSR
ncbi:hnRNP A1-gamma isoform [Flagelloscypha sp. PMI_526]|nr:hnRNP A1-gamma isoform [Flagelloscypha sp. PMI_526]